jgi:hypothetical protein
MPQTHLPPKMPTDAREIARAIELLNLRVQSELEKSEQTELKSLLGAYPSHAQAAVWRQGLRRILDGTDSGGATDEQRQADDQVDESNSE